MKQTTPNQGNDDDSISEAAAQWFMRLQDGDCTSAERDAFAQWLAADPRHVHEYQAMDQLWSSCEGLSPGQQGTTSAPPAKAGNYKRIFSFAAAVAVSLTIGWYQGWLPCERNSHEAGQSTRMVTLPDGSRVELNINTHVTYTRYRDRRVVSLDAGEAFFEVAHDSLHPFVVQAANGNIEATGTRFNVWMYQDQVKVMLVEGAIQMVSDSARADRSVHLSPGMQATYRQGDLQPQISLSRATDTSLAWRYGKLVFNDLPLRQALPLINRYLATPMMLADNATGDLRLGLSYNTREMPGLVSTLPNVLPVYITQNAQGNPVLHRNNAIPPRS